MNRKLLLPTIFLTLLTLAPVLSASFAYSFTYTSFNTTTWTYKQTDEARTAWQVEIVNNLVYNTTTAGTAKIELTNATSGNQTIIDLCYASDGTLDVWIGDETSRDKVTSGSWTADEKIYYTLDSNGYLDIGNETDRDSILSDYVLGAFSLEYVGASSQEGANVATSGYISVEITDAPISVEFETVTDIIYAVIPLIFTVAVLGVVIKMFKSVSK
ncbi:hypothetical protein DRO69_07165 [Candidatus Bathyarchaeota archaeon]|nr:MAG: hypothetical protein DRO69_07165 [Candidatus Bathyarchaeota archaeon]